MAKENIQAVEQADSQVAETEQKTSPAIYTEEQARSIYNEGQKAGYVSALKQMRTTINDYLNDLIISAELQQTQR